jgi:methyltransferase (TIGR00027 family)
MDTSDASRTAVLVCQGRAVAHGRLAVGWFSDPTALALLRAAEQVPVERAREGEEVRQWGERMEVEMLLANAEVMAARTVTIDDAVRERPSPQVVIVGAGLDGRAWRMDELAGVAVYEVDHPASQRDKLDRIERWGPADRAGAPAALTFVPVDLAVDPLDVALAGAGHDPGRATTWIWEGVVPYLTADAVDATVEAMAARSAPGSRIVVNYQQGSPVATLGRLVSRAMLRVARRDDPLTGEPWRSTWTARSMAELLAAHDFRVTRDVDLLAVAGELSIPTRHGRSLRHGRVAVADR